MSVPDAYSVVPAGGIVVDRYYPVIQSRVAQLRTPTPLQLYIRYEYKDAAGRPYTNEMTRRLEMTGVNQFEFSNLNDEDRSDSWFDYFNNAPLLSAFVTRMDESVKQFAGYVSEAAGGAAAAGSDSDALRWLAAAYEMERANHIVYQTPSGFLTQDHSNGQDIKFPRDVFRDKSGTCVDLAITYAALAEAVGLRANLMVVPGHTFAVVKLPSGKFVPVENTGLAGGDKSVPFDKAVEYGSQELQKYLSDGLYYLVNVSEQWTTGRIPNPELQPLGVDFLAQSGIRRMGATTTAATSAAPRKKNSSADGQLAGGQRLGAPVAEQEAPQGKQFTLVHQHGMGFCMGTLMITADSVIFQAGQATDGAKHHLEFKKTEMAEYKKNRLPIYQNGVAYPAFHIRLASGLYNFIFVDQYGHGLQPDQVLLELSH